MERGHKFDPALVDRLSASDRLAELDPVRILEAAGLSSGPGANESRGAAAERLAPNELPGSAVRTVVDLGAGPGIIARGISRLLPEAMVHAFDVSPEMVEHLRARLTDEERRRIRPRVSEESRIPLGDASADLLYMIDVYHELRDAQAVLAEARRVLRDDGTILVVDWAREGTSGGPPNHHRVPVEVLERELASAGFTELFRSESFAQHHAVRGRA
jgi:ubiquinone/menaquinone biosynthesis C-methylase UbiE